MARTRLEKSDLEGWLPNHAGWSLDGEALLKRFFFPDYPSTIAFVTRLAFASEKFDHHPDLHVSWGKVDVRWSTHDAGGLTSLDISLAERTDALAR